MRARIFWSSCFCMSMTLAVAGSAEAQEVTRWPAEAHHAVGVDTGLEGAFVARAKYTRAIDPGVLRDWRLFGRLAWPFVRPDLGDWGIDGGAQATLVGSDALRVALVLGPVARRTSNRLFSALGAGVGATLLAGYQGPRWGLSAEAGYEQFLTAYIEHSARYRSAYAGVKDGWYAASGSTATAGLRGGVRFGAVELAARVGLRATGQLAEITPPFYGTLGATFAF